MIQRRLTVSVLVPNYNHAPYLPRQLESLCSQTRPADEILVLDDGSTDGSVDVIEVYARRCSQMRVLRNHENRGLSAAMARLLSEATGDCLVAAAADDFLLPHFLERSLAALERHPEAGMCVSEFVVMETDGTIVNYSRKMAASFGLDGLPPYAPPSELRRRFRDGYVWMSSNTVVARRAAVEAAGGFRPELEWHADWFVFYAVALRHGACIVPEGLAVIRVNPGGYSDRGMNDPERQRNVLIAIADTLKLPSNRDLLPVFRRCPALLSVFGRQMARALQTMPRHWDILVPYVIYLARRYCGWHAPYWRAYVCHEIPRRIKAKTWDRLAHPLRAVASRARRHHLLAIVRQATPALLRPTLRRLRRFLREASRSR